MLTVERCSRLSKISAYNTTHNLTPVAPAADEILLPDLIIQIEPGCHRNVSRGNVITANTPPGQYVVHGIAVVDATIGKRSVPWSSGRFEVVARPDLTTIRK